MGSDERSAGTRRAMALQEQAYLEPLRITAEELAALPEYSATNPTGTTPGKRWMRWTSRAPSAPPPRTDRHRC